MSGRAVVSGAPGGRLPGGGAGGPGVTGGAFSGAPVVHRYTRAMAVRDGVLVDAWDWPTDRYGGSGGKTQAARYRAAVSLPAVRDVLRQHMGRAAGPGCVAFTAGAWRHLSSALGSPRWANDAAGVLHDALMMAKRAAALSYQAGGEPRAFAWILRGGRGAPGTGLVDWWVAATAENDVPGAVSVGCLTMGLPGED